MSPAGISAAIAAVERRGRNPILRSSGGGLLLDAYGGAINRVPRAATAFVHRGAAFLGQYFATLPQGASSAVTQANRTWLTAFWRSMRSEASGFAYQNYIDPDLADWRHAYYGANLERLVRDQGDLRSPRRLPIRAEHPGTPPLTGHRLGFLREDGRADEGDGLENRWACKRLVGSNPTPPAAGYRVDPAWVAPTRFRS